MNCKSCLLQATQLCPFHQKCKDSVMRVQGGVGGSNPKGLQACRNDSCHGSTTVFSSELNPPTPPIDPYSLLISSYLVTNLMGADLNNIVKFQKLSDEHVQFLIYQLLRGLKVIITLHLLCVIVNAAYT